ncbi:hypothetical protein BN946_scf185004.g32 [Trametes cinnabarina]|uniref:TFIIB-type domain-containing protein n=1 Tax=Pycnoporus cinnabarinus TaxID=5643 RepID=A0A060SK62_PYCCI|nr:hypothetical protein BN946_scf185004.g32 [Trametes cinnabarina]
MSGRCEECGATTEWDADLGSAICLQCGTLADPTQSVFTSQWDYVDTSTREAAPWSNIPGGSTLRGRNGRVLAGQDKEARDRRNTISMHEYIRGIAGRLSNPGVASRAQGIFDQAMARGQYRWGRRAKLTAGAALAIALREAHKSDSIRDIAYLLEERPVAVSRAFSAVVELLGLKLSTADPTAHFSVLQAYLASLVGGTQVETTFPALLAKVLPSLLARMSVVLRTANSLSVLLERTHALAHLPSPPTACALLILALEAEHGSSLPHAGVLAQSLGARVGAGKGVVMQRYKLIYDLVEEWIRDVPWLDAHERKRAKGRDGGGRSKVAKRVVVARGLKDVVQFQEEIWRKKVQDAGILPLVLDVEEGEGQDEEVEWAGSEAAGSSGVPQAPSGSSAERSTLGKSKRAKSRHPKPIADASQFLLNPLSSASSAIPSAALAPAHPLLAVQGNSRVASGQGSPNLLTHLLTADASSLAHAFREAPSRLQLLAAARGGADDAHIADDELFAEDELEGMLRAPAEIEAVRTAMGWDRDGEECEEVGKEGAMEKRRGKKRRREKTDEAAEERAGADGKGKAKAAGSKRIDMDALARLLNPDADLSVDAPDGREDYHDMDCEGSEKDEGSQDGEGSSVFAGSMSGSCEPRNYSAGIRLGSNAEEEEVVEEWRPMSPGGRGAGSAEDWYDF